MSDVPTVVPHWILLRGLAREAGHWGPFPAVLEKAIPGSRVTCLDMPGAGVNYRIHSPLSVTQITEFVREKFLEIRENEKHENKASIFNLVAVSLGGMVASDWLDRYPQDFASAVLINTSFKSYSPMYHRLTFRALYHLLNAVRSRDAEARELNVLKLVSNRPEIREQIAREWAEVARLRPVSYSNFARQLWAASRFSPKLTAPPVPVLVLVSERDRMVQPACSEVIARRWGIEVVRHPSAGHDMPLDDAPWVANEIRRFWQEANPLTQASET